MKIYRRMLYVGLGGTGLRIGMQLEQALRGELCGSNGRALMGTSIDGIQPFQLPRSLQFVYLDFDEADRGTAAQASVAMASSSAANATSQVVGNLSPTQDSFAYAAESLRISARDSVPWLPPKEGEPQVSPLSEGAGQLPTVGRAALFETFRAAGGAHVVMGALKEAFARLNSSMGDLAAISSDSPSAGFDVFVGFSVAGGTGAGIFYDVLRLIGEAGGQFDDKNPLAIYPLVVMPSAFEDEFPAATRSHQLNGGPALKELFDLVETHHTTSESLESVVYPGSSAVDAAAKVPTKTAFLFSRPNTLTIDDLHRSIVAFVLSTIGTTVQTDHGEDFRPLTSHLINVRQLAARSPDGVGRRPASTALAAELRIPLEEIAEILAQRMLANSTRILREPEPNEGNENFKLFSRFGAITGLDVLANPRLPATLSEVDGMGAKELTTQLADRNDEAVKALRSLRTRLQPTLAKLAAECDYVGAIEALATEYDLFRVSRVVLGDADFALAAARDGFRGAVSRMGQEPPPNPNPKVFTESPPALPVLKDPMGRLKRIGPNTKEVRLAVQAQNDWYEWRVAVEVHEVWKSLRETWEPRLEQMAERMRDITATFDEQAAREPDEFMRGNHRLYRKRTGVVYFVPDGGPQSDLGNWYSTAVLPRLCEVLNLPEATDEGRILRKVMHGVWKDALRETARNASREAPREYVLNAIKKVLIEEVLASGDENSLLPRIETILRAAAHHDGRSASDVPARLLDIFKRRLQQLLPGDFRPDGSSLGDSGHLQVDVFYPSSQEDTRINEYLERTALTSVSADTAEFHALTGVDFLSIVLRREALAATAVDEYRRMMRLRDDVLSGSTTPVDYLPWRQRLGYDPNWLVLRREDGARVLGAMLSAMWDGSVRVVEGTSGDPKWLHIFQSDETAGAPLELALDETVGGVSRWCGLLAAYERYVLAGDAQARERCARLIERSSPTVREASPLYLAFQAEKAVQTEQAKRLYAQLREQARARNSTAEPPMPRAYQFWVELLPLAEEHNRNTSVTWLTIESGIGAGPTDDDVTDVMTERA